MVTSIPLWSEINKEHFQLATRQIHKGTDELNGIFYYIFFILKSERRDAAFVPSNV